MIPGAFIYRTSSEIEGLYESFLGGLFLVKGLPLLVQLTVLTSLLLAVFFALREKKGLSIFFSLLGFVSTVTLLHQPWDELFVNLLHSRNFAEHHFFSFSASNPVEGTVDTLPYFFLGILNKLGLPLVEMSLGMSLLGGIACIFLGAFIIQSIAQLPTAAWPIFALSVYSPLLFNSSHGFTATLFSAALLASLYFIEIKRKAWGWIFVALIPFIRTEGLWFVLLYTGRFFVSQKKVVQFWVLVPVFIHVMYRWRVFGSLTPLPMQYKAAFGNPFFLLLGIRNLWCDLLASYSLILFLFYWSFRQKEKFLDHWLLLLLLTVLPYYLSGGDWFPAAWGRYLLPFSLVLFVSALSVIGKKAKNFLGKEWLKLSPLFTVSVVFILLPSSSYVSLFDDIFSKRKTLSNTVYREKSRTNFRIQYLSQVGTHLAKVTTPTQLIATSELATLHYFANRSALDLLGITNSEIISEPLRTPSLLRRFPKNNELPYLIFRRVNTDLVEKHQPAIVYPFDFILKDLMNETTFKELNEPLILKALARWEHRFEGLMEPLYGGTAKLLKLGYEPFIVLYENEFATLYFVQKNDVANHQIRLKELGFSGGLYYPSAK